MLLLYMHGERKGFWRGLFANTGPPAGRGYWCNTAGCNNRMIRFVPVGPKLWFVEN